MMVIGVTPLDEVFASSHILDEGCLENQSPRGFDRQWRESHPGFWSFTDTLGRMIFFDQGWMAEDHSGDDSSELGPVPSPENKAAEKKKVVKRSSLDDELHQSASRIESREDRAEPPLE
ncbi:hypothetical protein QJS10_CPB17g00814 [Acorus calamus]|uniref:Uncharacterized protein n=1 Tax=Acorus calamus TaxID=4465 RepID=A0AAV9CWA4_ACOCL|nr:hypothetical protein QJS10_CPB17g00814 [Acorus calamus]